MRKLLLIVCALLAIAVTGFILSGYSLGWMLAAAALLVLAFFVSMGAVMGE